MNDVHDTGNKVKVALESPDGQIETLWADVVGRDLYQLDNIPFYAYNVSDRDIVEARFDDAGQRRMTRVVRKSGNRTIRVILELSDNGQYTTGSENALAGILERGCGYEGAGKKWIAVNVPQQIDLAAIAEFLVQTGFRWEYADPQHNDLFAEDPNESTNGR